MKPIALPVALIAVLMACVMLPALAADPPAADAAKVVRFVSTKEANLGGQKMLVLVAAPKFGGANFDIAVPNAGPAARTTNPDPTMAVVLKAAKAGDYLKATYSRQQSRLVLSKVEAYTPKPGETDPEAYEFVKTIRTTATGQDYQAVVARKADKEQTLLIPNVKDAAGAMATDARVLAQVEKLKPGDFADAETVQAGTDTLLKGIYPYQAPISATFVKLGSEKSADGAAMTTVEFKQGDRSATAYVRMADGGKAPEPVMASKVRALKANSPALYKAVEEDGKSWLIYAKAAPQPAGPAMPAGNVTLNGTFATSYKRGQNTPLKVVLKPTGPGEWSAVYTFTWDGAPKTYTGTVKGDLKNGDVSGTGSGDNRRFVWEGKSQNGVVTFSHFELSGNRRTPTGSATIQ